VRRENEFCLLLLFFFNMSERESPDPSALDAQVLVQYLLGLLPEGDTNHLDELSVADDEFAMRLSLVENDLVDAYVRDEVSEEIRERFRTFYLSSAKRREKVRFAAHFFGLEGKTTRAGARMLAAAADAGGQRGFPAKGSWFSRFFVPNLGFAAATAMVIVTSGLLVDNIGLHHQMKQDQADRAALQQREQALQATLDEQHTAHAETVKQLDQVREALSLLEKHPAANRLETGMPSPFSIASFVLSPQMRGSAQMPLLSLPRGTSRIDFHLELESDDFPEYRVALRDPVTGRILWRSGTLKAQTGGQSSTVSIVLPAKLLKRQNYMLELTGGRGNGDKEVLGSYVFRVGGS
jgi:hypothetical protein